MALVLAASLLSPNVGLMFWITITFLLLMFVLRRFAWGPITSALTTREHRIEESIRSAEKALEEARQIQADNTKARQEAEQSAQQILRDARASADSLRSEEMEKTRSQIQRMQEQATAEIEREKEGALDELRTEVADLAIKAAEKILSESLDATRQRKLVDGFLKDLSKN
ncbi:MAG: F0F1 ATP synthase subunit B [Rhodothermales bacterium]|nr:F0F1 ATP synthase subunit B [Rhodothermales bacterium]